MVTLNVNGTDYQVSAEPDELLVWVVHEKIGLTRTRFGCGIEMCGACNLLVDGEITRSCTTEVGSVIGKEIVTREALPADHPIITGKE